MGSIMTRNCLSLFLIVMRHEKRSMRCCEPRDLILRCLDICRYSDQPPGLSRICLNLPGSITSEKNKARPIDSVVLGLSVLLPALYIILYHGAIDSHNANEISPCPYKHLPVLLA